MGIKGNGTYRWGDLPEDDRPIFKASRQRMKRLEEALEQIREGKWTGSGDRQGATFAEIRAMKMADKALREAANA